MAVRKPDGDLHVYFLNVGQGDTTVIVSPGGSVAIVDACQPHKLIGLLRDVIGFDGHVEHLVITHPHSDHYNAGNHLIRSAKTIKEATLAPFWHRFGFGLPGYTGLVARLERTTRTRFLAGYSRWYPDGTFTRDGTQSSAEIDDAAPYLELLGPSNGLVRQLEDSGVFKANHLSLIVRLTWKGFRLLIGGDCQLENWSFFDHERMMEGGCSVLRASHHGSKNGTQWERISRLKPRVVVVSSDPDRGHKLPDLGGCAVFAPLDLQKRMVLLTGHTGSLHLTVPKKGRPRWRMFREQPEEIIDAAKKPMVLYRTKNPTDWFELLNRRVEELGLRRAD